MNIRRHIALAIASLAAMAVSLMPNTAHADPEFQPGGDDIVGIATGSTRHVLNDLADAYNATNPGRRIAIWDPVNPITGQPGDTVWVRDANDNGVAETNEVIIRPNGCSAAIAEMRRDPECDGIPNSTIDFVGCGRGRRADDSECGGVTGGPQVLFLPFASDDVRYAVNSDNVAVGDFPGDSAGTNAPLDLTTAELTGIYDCTVRTWADLRPGLSSDTIVPLAPQEGSGTRQALLESLGLTEFGPCVDDSVHGHDAHPIDGDPNAIAPFSVALFTTRVPADANGDKPVQLNSGGFMFTRPLYIVVIDRTPADGPFEAGGIDPRLHDFLGDNDVDWGWICSNDAAPIIANAGFTQLPTIDEFDPGASHFCGLSE